MVGLRPDQAQPAHQAFYGTSDNAVRTQIWIAICSYVLVAILRKRPQSELSLYTMSQILSVSLFEKIELSQAFSRSCCGGGRG
jgi:hypothetical protein